MGCFMTSAMSGSQERFSTGTLPTVKFRRTHNYTKRCISGWKWRVSAITTDTGRIDQNLSRSTTKRANTSPRLLTNFDGLGSPTRFRYREGPALASIQASCERGLRKKYATALLKTAAKTLSRPRPRWQLADHSGA